MFKDIRYNKFTFKKYLQRKNFEINSSYMNITSCILNSCLQYTILLFRIQFQNIYCIQFFESQMQIRHSRKESDVVKIENYNTMKNQLEAQNASLMKERMGIQQQSRFRQNILPGNNFTPVYLNNQQEQAHLNSQYSQIKHSVKNNLFQSLKSKICQIINICQDHKYGGTQLTQIANAEKEILGFLDGFQNKKSQSRLQRSSKKKKNNLNKTQNEIYKQSDNYLGDQAMNMIQQIQRKAFIEIENLRNDKINLMRKLNEEIKNHNEQKKLRLFYQNKFKYQANKPYGSNRMQVVAEQNQEHYENQNPIEHLQQQNNLQLQGYLKSGIPQKRILNNINNNIQQYPNNNSRIQININSPNQHNGRNSNGNKYKNGAPIQNHTNVPQSQKQFSQQQIINQIQNLRTENETMKQAFPNHTNKSQLRSQITQLQERIRSYQHALNNKRQQQGDNELRQLQSLINQGSYLSDQARLLRNKQNGQDYRTTAGSFENQQARYRVSNQNQNNYGRQYETKRTGERSNPDYTRPQLQTFSPMDKSFHAQTYKSKFSPSKYQTLITQMNNAARV